MKDYFKSKFFYVVAVLALVCTIVPSVFYSMGLTFVFRDAVNVALTPMQKLFNSAAESLDGFAAYFYKFDELAEENNELKQQVADLQAQIYEAQQLEELYAWMSDFLEMKRLHTDFEMTEASVTGRESGNFSRILTLDVGSGAGIELNMPVVTAEGIVGRVTEVGYSWCKVTTIVEANSSVGAYIERSGAAGVCEGKFELQADGLIELSYLPGDSEVREGDRVLSTGFGSVYPRGLCVGYVESIETNPYSRSLSVKVKCAADYSTLSRVMIITSFTSTAVNGSEK